MNVRVSVTLLALCIALSGCRQSTIERIELSSPTDGPPFVMSSYFPSSRTLHLVGHLDAIYRPSKDDASVIRDWPNIVIDCQPNGCIVIQYALGAFRDNPKTVGIGAAGRKYTVARWTATDIVLEERVDGGEGIPSHVTISMRDCSEERHECAVDWARYDSQDIQPDVWMVRN
jgi:hypothetical protein